LYAIISRVDADGTSNKTTVATSETTEALDDTEVAFDVHAAVADDIEVLATARLILDIYANVGAGAQDAVITLYMEGADDSYFSTKVDSGIWQNHGDVLDDLNTVGEVTGDNYMLVGTSAGVFAWETGATLRTSIGVDAAGTAAGLVSGHESTYNHGNYNTAYSHSQLVTGNPHAVTPTELGLVIGTNVQAYDAGLLSLAGLVYVSASFIKATAGDTYALRTIADTKSDLSLNLVENTALSTWAGTASITTLGTIASGVWNGTDIAIADGGTGQGTAQLAINALSAVGAATNEHVLTKDTVTGNAIWKAATGGADAFTVKVDAAATAGYLGAANADVLRTSTGITKTDGGDFITLTTNDSQIAHDSLSGYSANKHVDHSTMTVAIANGGTGQTTQQTAVDALTAVAGATNEHVLTKDTATGNAIWKAATGGADAFTVKVDAAAAADYLGATAAAGALRTGVGLTKTDGGDFITLAQDISGLTAITAIDAAADYVPVWDATDSTIKKILPTNIGHRFVNRGDPSVTDWYESGSKTVLNTDATERILDCSSIVPAGATAILFTVSIQDDAVGAYLRLMGGGQINAISRAICRVQVANAYIDMVSIIPCNAARQVIYYGTNHAFTAIYLSIMGWWV
jgi:hypothetical protein